MTLKPRIIRLFTMGAAVLVGAAFLPETVLAKVLPRRPTTERAPIYLVDGMSVEATGLKIARQTAYLLPTLQRAAPAMMSKVEAVGWLEWHGDVSRSFDALATLESDLLLVARDHPGTTIVGHSWGGVLAYLALRNLETSGRVRPGEFPGLITIHTQLQLKKRSSLLTGPTPQVLEGIRVRVNQIIGGPLIFPRSVAQGNWFNYWSPFDALSGEIRVATNVDTHQSHTKAITDPQAANRYPLVATDYYSPYKVASTSPPTAETERPDGDTSRTATKASGASEPTQTARTSDPLKGDRTWKVTGSDGYGRTDLCTTVSNAFYGPAGAIYVTGLFELDAVATEEKLRTLLVSAREYAKSQCVLLQTRPHSGYLGEQGVMVRLFEKGSSEPTFEMFRVPLTGDPLVDARTGKQRTEVTNLLGRVRQQHQREAVAKKCGIDRWLDSNGWWEVERNPYLFRGKTVGVRIEGLDIMNETTAMVQVPGHFLVGGFPATTFKPGRGPYLLCATVQGKVNGMTVLKFVTIEEVR